MSRGLLLVAHGSRDDAAREATERIAELVRAELPGVDVTIGYLEHCQPDVTTALASLRGDNDAVTVVPLLFAPGKHNDSDVPALVLSSPNVTLAPPLGPDPLVAAALRDRLIEAETPADAAVVVVSAGSKDSASLRSTEATARMLAEGTGWDVTATDANSDLSSLIAAARTESTVVAVAPLLLAPGSFAERIQVAAHDAGADIVAAPISDHPAIALLVAKRYTATTEVAA